MKTKIEFANKVDVHCLVSGRGHEFVTVQRDKGSVIESWMECYSCQMTIMELEIQERDCNHEMICKKCAFPLMRNRSAIEGLEKD